MEAKKVDNKKKFWGSLMLCLVVLLISIRSISKGIEREETWKVAIAFIPAVIFVILVVATGKKFYKKAD